MPAAARSSPDAVTKSPASPPQEQRLPTATEEASVENSEPATTGVIDEIAESEFRAEARLRGESVAPAVASVEAPDPLESSTLPKIEELTKRIPAEVREQLEDLFRARFVAVRRFPKTALK